MIEPAGMRRGASGSGQGGETSATNVSPLTAAKAALRAEGREWLQTVSAELRQRASMSACRVLEGQAEWRKARTVMVYAPRQDELDITELIDQGMESGKILALPQYQADAGCYRLCRLEVSIRELSIGRYGIPEPGVHCAHVPLDQVDLALVPGVAFDVQGHRLGRGRGYYDRLLASLRAVKCGVGFDEQVQPHIPVEPHDVVLDCILTPTRWVAVHPPGHGNDVGG